MRMVIRRLFGRYPHVCEALYTRAERYNAALDHVAELERKDRALVVRPETMPVKNATLDTARLEAAYALGYEQAQRELPRILRFVGLA